MTRSRDVADTQDNLGGAVAPFVAGKNILINGAFDYWQRGTSFSVGGYTADRWYVDTGTITRQTGTGSFPYALQIANASGNPALRQGFELPFAGNAGQFQVGTTWTISFLAKTSTSISSQLAVFVSFNDGVNVGANAVQIASSTTVGASSTSWTKYTYTFTVASSPAGTNTCVMVVPYLASGAYAGNFSITQIQLEQGALSTPFARAGGSIGGELALCQRYYYLHSATAARYISMAAAYNATTTYGYLQFPVSMRTNPTMAVVSGTNYYLFYRNGTYQYINSFSQDAAYPTGSGLYATGLTQTAGTAGWFQIENAAGSVSFSAEL